MSSEEAKYAIPISTTFESGLAKPYGKGATGLACRKRNYQICAGSIEPMSVELSEVSVTLHWLTWRSLPSPESLFVRAVPVGLRSRSNRGGAYRNNHSEHEAIDMAKRIKPDSITLDVSMPVMNGLEAAPKQATGPVYQSSYLRKKLN
jgi:hypothetical protein